MIQPKFSIGDKVYHVTLDSEEGVVLDASYSMLRKRWKYLVTFGIRDNDSRYYEHELLSQRRIV